MSEIINAEQMNLIPAEQQSIVPVEELFSVTQLPIITEHLASAKASIEARCAAAASMDCTEETRKQVKSLRATLNKEAKELETMRKQVKEAVNAPYTAFEAVYKDCIINPYKAADKALADKIASVEDGMLKEKREKALAYFREECEANHIDFLNFEETGAKVNLTTSLKSIQQTIHGFVDRVATGWQYICRMDDEEAAEIFRNNGYNALAAEDKAEQNRRDRARRKDEMLAAQQRAAAEKAHREQVAAAARADLEAAATAAPTVPEVTKADVQETFAAPVAEPVAEPVEQPVRSEKELQVMQLTFTVKAPLWKLRELKKFLTDGEYEIVK